MTTRQKLEAKGLNINTLIVLGGGIITISGGVWAVAEFLVPLKGVPGEVSDLRKTQITQTEALKTLANLAAESKEARDRSIQHDTEIREVKRRLDRLESR